MLPIDLKGKKVFIAGIGDDKGFGWAIAKAMFQAGATILVGTWTPMLKIFTLAFNSGKFDEARRCEDGAMLEFAGIYPIDAVFDRPEDVPSDIKENKRYKNVEGYTVSEVAQRITDEHGQIDILVHSLANSPEIKQPLLKTSRQGYLSALSASSYSFISLLAHFAPHINRGGAALNLSYLASERVIPGYGGGMSSAKAALESDTRTLAYEVGTEYGIRVNSISAGAYGSRAAKAIGFIDQMIEYSTANAPLHRAIEAKEVGCVAAFLASNLASGITGEIVHVDCGLHAMGLSLDSPCLQS